MQVVAAVERVGGLLATPRQWAWFGGLDGGTSRQVEVIAIDVKGPFDAEVLGIAMRDLALRHPALRRCLLDVAGELVQVVVEACPPAGPACDLTGMKPAFQERAVRAWVLREAGVGFMTGEVPLWRWSWGKLGDGHHVVLVVLHASVCDGWSREVLVEDLRHLYMAAFGGRHHGLPDLQKLGGRSAPRRGGGDVKAVGDFWAKELGGARAQKLPVRDAWDGVGVEQVAVELPRMDRVIVLMIALVRKTRWNQSRPQNAN